MATRYWVGGGGEWGTSTTNWSTTSGGAGGASVPTSADDVIFDANSGSGNYTVTFTTVSLRECLSLTVSNPSGGTVSFTTISTSTTLSIYGDVDIQAGSFAAFSGQLRLRAFSGGVGTAVDVSIIPSITTAGSMIGFQGDSDTSTFNVISNLNIRYIYLQRGIVNFGSYTHTVTFFYNELSNTVTTSNVTINLDSCTLNTPSLRVYGATTTFNAGTSSVVATSSSSFIGKVGDLAITLYNYTFNYTGSTNDVFNIYPPVTFNSLTVNVTTATRQVVQFYNDCTIGTLSVTGQLVGQYRPFIQSSTAGTARTLTVTTATTVDYADFQDITVAGGASPISGTMLGDCGGNTGITFPASKTVYWNLPAGGDWASTAWATTSGGVAANTNYPLPQDTAIIENTGLNSGLSINFSTRRNISSIDWSSRTVNFSFSNLGSSLFYGSLTYPFGSSIGNLNGTLNIVGGRSQTILRNSLFTTTLGVTVLINKSPNSFLQLGSGLTTTGQLILVSGGLDLNGFTAVFYGAILRDPAYVSTTLPGSVLGPFTLAGNNGTLRVRDGSTINFSNYAFYVTNSTNFSITSDVRFLLNTSGATFALQFSGGNTVSGITFFNLEVELTSQLFLRGFSCNNMVFTSVFTGTLNVDTGTNYVFGNFTYSVNGQPSNSYGGQLVLYPPSGVTVTLDTKSKDFSDVIFYIRGISGTRGTVSLASSLTCAGIQWTTSNNFTFLTNSYDITGKLFWLSNAYVDLGTSTLTLGDPSVSSLANTTFFIGGPNFSYSSGAEIRSVGYETRPLTFQGDNGSYPTLVIASRARVTITGNNTFENVQNTVSSAHLRITSGSTQTFNNFELSGTAGNLVTLDSTTTSQHTLISPVDVKNINYLNISYSNASGPISTQWYAGANSVNSGNNTGWQFVNAPPPPKGEFFMIMLG